jgi:hypothetical protein
MKAGAVTPPPGGLVRLDDETMFDSDHGTKKGIDRPLAAVLDEGTCPRCGRDISRATSAGPDEVVVNPCGCSLPFSGARRRAGGA